jgi:hypothetical protein
MGITGDRSIKRLFTGVAGAISRYPLAEAVFAEQIRGAKWFQDIAI